MNYLWDALEAILALLSGLLAGLILYVLFTLIVAAGSAWMYRGRHNVRGGRVSPPDVALAASAAPGSYYGSMNLADEQEYLRRDWRAQYERQLAPEALAGQEVMPYGPATFADVPMRELPASKLVSPGPGSVLPPVAEPRPGPELGPGAGERTAGYNSHLPSGNDSMKVDSPAPDDLLSSLSDDDFWNIARFELRRIVFESYEPFQLTAWTEKAAA